MYDERTGTTNAILDCYNFSIPRDYKKTLHSIVKTTNYIGYIINECIMFMMYLKFRTRVLCI